MTTIDDLTIFAHNSSAILSGLAYQNIIVNPNGLISQENSNTAVTTSGSFPADQWEYHESGATMVGSAQQVSDAPPGYTSSLKMTITTAQASIGSSEYLAFRQVVEGNRISHLGWGASGGSTATLGFWVKASVTGTFGGGIRNHSASTHCFVFSFTINATNTWEWKTVSIPTTTSGTWTTSTSPGLDLWFTLACGTTFLNTAGWNTGNYIGVTGQSNLAATLSNTFQLTGVVLLPGTMSISSTNAFKLQRRYDDELRLCQRYYCMTYSTTEGHKPGTATYQNCLSRLLDGTQSYAGFLFEYPTEMRVAGSATIYNPATGASGSMRGDASDRSPAVASPISTTRCRIYLNGVSVGTSVSLNAHVVVNARL